MYLFFAFLFQYQISSCMEYRIIVSLNHLAWKKPLRSLSPTFNPALRSLPLNHAPKGHIYMFFEYPQGWWLNYLLPWTACSSFSSCPIKTSFVATRSNFLLSYSMLLGRRDWLPLLYNLLSDRCSENRAPWPSLPPG